MRVALCSVLVIAAAAPSADAQPGTCRIAVTRAPAEVRAEIERWIAAEPHCVRSIELRAVVGDDGIYLFARDDRGLTRERMVPDASTAGVLVASWMADDAVPATVPHTELSVPAPPAVIAPVSSDRGRALRIVGLGTALAGIAVLGSAVYEHVEASRISSDIANHPSDAPWPSDIRSLQDRGQRAERLEYILLAGGGVLVATGAVTYLVGRARASSEALLVVPSATAQSVGVGVAGRF
jgi:hypothetical protein